MKKSVILLVIALFFLNSCVKEREHIAELQDTWCLAVWNTDQHVIDNNCEYPAFDCPIYWTFKETQLQTNVGIDLGVYDYCISSFSDGELPYNVLVQDQRYFLLVDDEEIGEITLHDNKLVIDGFSRSTGPATDTYYFEFIKRR